ncbi:MAG: bifunctional adenosylcobinamide kinase/adenosylcobinamide-phosphate guanylyltransferase [Pleurocapsa minor GSE-CHR-MK-17-07R]|jgi:adenosylcobinamide kinase/adenosylcobinamide-phosphate guanylyltransferase|nr:bifunctional adenosylcobinamide kinase/adenosylcobinamide-phosphate guanylyltransferase [Pleurocapsa minor GSE-CHR-MK 17-07R]
MTLILGGARGGKSATAERMARESGGRVLFVATAQAFDDEMRERIDRHRSERPAEWDTLEAPLNVAQAIQSAAAQPPYDVILLDCITLLATNALLTLPESCTQDEADAVILREIEALIVTIGQVPAHWLIVSNEVGMGIVPPTHLGRVFRDALGRANQALARRADDVLLVVAGLPWALKGHAPGQP